MSTEQTWETESTSLDNTLSLAASIGSKLKGGEVIELISDLGGGKTAFVRGLAAGMGSKDDVKSPSFTLAHQYKAGPLTLHHLDFYRLSEPGIMKDELREIMDDKTAVIAVEWASIVEEVMPSNRLSVSISATGEDQRQIKFKYPKQLSYLFPDNT